MPRWTAYLLWSTRKRRDVVVDHPEWSFSQIAKWISDEWKKVQPTFFYVMIQREPRKSNSKFKILDHKK